MHARPQIQQTYTAPSAPSLIKGGDTFICVHATPRPVSRDQRRCKLYNNLVIGYNKQTKIHITSLDSGSDT